jgi:type IV secretory pathway VirB10-like protein
MTMRTQKLPNLLAAFIALMLLLAAACNRGGGAPQAGQPADRQATAAAPPGETAPGTAPRLQPPQANELRPLPQTVKVEPPPASPAGQGGERAADLAAREKLLAERQAALEARERRLGRRHHGGAPRDEAASRPGAPAPDTASGGASMETSGAAPAPSEPAPGPAPAEEPAARPRPTAIAVPAGTPFDVEFTRRLASNTSSVGDTFRARVISDVVVDGAVAIPGGSEVLGVVTDAVALGRFGGQARLGLKFTDLVLPSGSTVPIHATFFAEGRNKAGQSAATIGGSTAGGAILGRILSNRGKGTVIGALVGAAVGTAIAANHAGEEVVIPEGSVVRLRFTE